MLLFTGTGELQTGHMKETQSPANSISSKEVIVLKSMTTTEGEGHSNNGFQLPEITDEDIGLRILPSTFPFLSPSSSVLTIFSTLSGAVSYTHLTLPTTPYV